MVEHPAYIRGVAGSSPAVPIAEVTMFNYYGGKWKKKRKNILRKDGYV